LHPPTHRVGELEESAMEALLTTIVLWLSVNFGLPATYEHPNIEIAPPAKMATVRFRGLTSNRVYGIATEAGRRAEPEFGSEVYALYDDQRRTIYLHEGWTGASPRDVSLLVHEIVHHLQNAAGQKFLCPQEREKAAYKAQSQWLAQFGRTLEQDFEIDPMTMLVRTNCEF
jgi:hypothetical protein